jgi:amino acid transporter
VVIAMFDTGLCANLGYARIYFAAGRDRLWPGPLNGFFAHLGRRSQVPVYGFAVLFVGNGLLCIFSSLNDLITFTGVVIVIVYALVAVSAVVVRIRDSKLRGSFRMPLWPLRPIVALAGIGIAISQQKARDMLIAGAITLLALIGYLLARRGLPGRLELAPSDPNPLPAAPAPADPVS